MIAKLIVKGRNRDEAVIRMKRALDEFVIEGVPTTIAFHQKILDHPEFISGNYDINFLERFNNIEMNTGTPEKKTMTITRASETPVAETLSTEREKESDDTNVEDTTTVQSGPDKT